MSKLPPLLTFSPPSCDISWFILKTIYGETSPHHRQPLCYWSYSNVRGCIVPQLGNLIRSWRWTEEKGCPSRPLWLFCNKGIDTDVRRHQFRKISRTAIGRKGEGLGHEYGHSDNAMLQIRHRFCGTCGSVQTGHWGHYIGLFICKIVLLSHRRIITCNYKLDNFRIGEARRIQRETPQHWFKASRVSIWINDEPLDLVDALPYLGHTITYINSNWVAVYHYLCKAEITG